MMGTDARMPLRTGERRTSSAPKGWEKLRREAALELSFERRVKCLYVKRRNIPGRGSNQGEGTEAPGPAGGMPGRFLRNAGLDIAEGRTEGKGLGSPPLDEGKSQEECKLPSA